MKEDMAAERRCRMKFMVGKDKSGDGALYQVLHIGGQNILIRGSAYSK